MRYVVSPHAETSTTCSAYTACVPVETCIFMCVLTALNTALVVAYVVAEGFKRTVERWQTRAADA